MSRLSVHVRHASYRLAATLAAGWMNMSAASATSLQAPELQILSKALTFLEPPLASRLTVAVVYSSGNAESRRDADGLAGALSNMSLGGESVTARVVGTDGLATADFQLVITAAGVDGEAVIAAANAHHALCVTADVDAVRIGHCTMAIRSARRVEIFVNREAALQSGISFATAFRMMVHEQ